MAKQQTPVDYSFDQIGKRLSGVGLTKHERLLAKDDRVRVDWILSQMPIRGTVIDIGASDGAIAQQLQRRGHRIYAIECHVRHAAQRNMWWFAGNATDGLLGLPYGLMDDVTLCGEIFEHLTVRDGAALAKQIPTTSMIVTVPNRNCKSYKVQKRDRADYPDHRRDFSAASLRGFLESCEWNVETLDPIVGVLTDSIWLGAVCIRA